MVATEDKAEFALGTLRPPTMDHKPSSSLPLEIWDHIIDDATGIPGEFSFEIAYQTPILGGACPTSFNIAKLTRPNPDTHRQEWLATIGTRAAIVLVCHSWHSMGIHRLYSSLIVDGWSAVDRILSSPRTRTLSTHHCRRIAVTGPCPLGTAGWIFDCQKLTHLHVLHGVIDEDFLAKVCGNRRCCEHPRPPSSFDVASAHHGRSQE